MLHPSTPGTEASEASASGIESAAKARRSRIAIGAVWWLIPRVNNDMRDKLMDKRSIFLLLQHNFKLIALVAATCVISACAAGSQQRQDDLPEGHAEETREESVPLSERLGDEVDPEVQFHVLAAERLADTGQYIDAAEQYLQAAMMSEFPELARQASRMAARLGHWELVVAAAGRWAELAPDNRDARELLILARMNTGQADLAVDGLVALIEDHDDLQEGWRRAAMLIGVSDDEERALEILSELIGRTGRDEFSPEVLHIQSMLHLQVGDEEAALEKALRAANAGDEQKYLVWVAQLAGSQDNYELALEYYRQARRRSPDDLPLALSEAEALRQLERPDEALEVLASMPQTLEVLYTRTLYLIEAGERDAADAVWWEISRIETEEEPELKAFMVAQLAELLERDEDALAWYERVDQGPNRNRAALRRAVLISRTDDMDRAREVLGDLRREAGPSMELQSWLLEAELLREAGRAEEAVDVLSAALRERPGSIRLLYNRALGAVVIGDIDLAEQDLRRIIQIDGENAMALNALGYTLTDRTDRHGEAYRLIRRALELDPDDPATLDSMGWVYFRLGRPEQALPYLERALAGDDNPEIAAHLIEVLWTLERRDDAREVIDHALEHYPEDDYLVDTLERLGLPD